MSLSAPYTHNFDYFFSTHCGSRSSELISANNWWYARSVSLLMIIMSKRWPHRASMSRAVAIISFSSSSCCEKFCGSDRLINAQLLMLCLIFSPYKARLLEFSSVATFPSLAGQPEQYMALGLTGARVSSSADVSWAHKSFHSRRQLELLPETFLIRREFCVKNIFLSFKDFFLP